MAAMWRWMRLPEAEIVPGITPASASTPNNEPLIAPGAHLAAATLCPPNNRKTFRRCEIYETTGRIGDPYFWFFTFFTFY